MAEIPSFRLGSVTTPDPVLAGGPAFILSYNGNGFLGAGDITPYFDGVALTDFNLESSTLLKATVPAALITLAGDYQCYLRGDADPGVTVMRTFTVLTAEGEPPAAVGDPCTVEDAIRKATDGSCLKCVGGVWVATAAGDCSPAAGGLLTDIYVYGLETHEEFFDHFDVEMRDAIDGSLLQFHSANGHFTEALALWTMDGFMLFEGVTQGQTYFFRARVVTANGIPSEWSAF